MKGLFLFIIYYFLFFIEKFVTKNRAFGNNTIFLQQFFRFRGNFLPFRPANPLDSREVRRSQISQTFQYYMRKIKNHFVCSALAGVLSGGRGKSPSPKPKKIAVEKWCYFLELYKMRKIQKDGMENDEKVNFPLRLLYVNFKVFSTNLNPHWV